MPITVSVIVPCYLQARFLESCIRSLQRQTLRAWEAVIVDDGSPDDTETVVSTLALKDPRIRYVKKSNGGLASARNAGLRAAKGEYLQFLDADDLIESRKLERQVAYLQQRAEIDVVFGNAWYFLDADQGQRVRVGGAPWWLQNRNWIEKRARDPTPMTIKLLRRNQFPVCAPLVRSSLVERAGGFNEQLCLLEDWEFWLRCATVGGHFEFFESAKTDVHIRIHGASMSVDKRRMKRAELDLAMTAMGYIRDPELRRLACQLATTGLEALDGDDWQQARDAVAAAVVADVAAARALRLYESVCNRFRAGSLARKIAHRALQILA